MLASAGPPHAALFPPPDICIVGAGIAGLVAAALLEQAHLPYIVLEKRSLSATLDGADMGLWPAAVAIIDDLLLTLPPLPSSAAAAAAAAGTDEGTNGNDDDSAGIALSSDRCSYPVRAIRLLRPGRRAKDLTLADDSALLLHNTGSHAYHHLPRISSRRRLVQRLLRRLPADRIVYDASVLQLQESDSHVEVMYTVRSTFATMTVPIVIGADGAGSYCAAHVDRQVALRSTGVIYHRGIVDLSPHAQTSSRDLATVRAHFVDQELQNSNCMHLHLHNDSSQQQQQQQPQQRHLGFLASFGFLDKSFSRGYWWVREPYSAGPGSLDEIRRLRADRVDKSDWPEPFRTLYRVTEQQFSYIQPGSECSEPRKTFTKRVVLLGDAAQGPSQILFHDASSAVEDAYLFINLLRDTPLSIPLVDLFRAFHDLKHSSAAASSTSSAGGGDGNPKSLSSSPVPWMRRYNVRAAPSAMFEHRLRKLRLFDPLASLGAFNSSSTSLSSASILSRPSSRTFLPGSSTALRRSGENSSVMDQQDDLLQDDSNRRSVLSSLSRTNLPGKRLSDPIDDHHQKQDYPLSSQRQPSLPRTGSGDTLATSEEGDADDVHTKSSGGKPTTKRFSSASAVANTLTSWLSKNRLWGGKQQQTTRQASVTSITRSPVLHETAEQEYEPPVIDLADNASLRSLQPAPTYTHNSSMNRTKQQSRTRHTSVYCNNDSTPPAWLQRSAIAHTDTKAEQFGRQLNLSATLSKLSLPWKSRDRASSADDCSPPAVPARRLLPCHDQQHTRASTGMSSGSGGGGLLFHEMLLSTSPPWASSDSPHSSPSASPPSPPTNPSLLPMPVHSSPALITAPPLRTVSRLPAASVASSKPVDTTASPRLAPAYEDQRFHNPLSLRQHRYPPDPAQRYKRLGMAALPTTAVDEGDDRRMMTVAEALRL